MTLGAILLFAQASVPVAAPPGPTPDIELRAHIEARQVDIEQDGAIRVNLTVDPVTSAIEVKRSQPKGARSYQNLTIDARVAAVISLEDDGTVLAGTTSSTGEQPQ